ncbi:hypothetical protein D9619_007944 [Psilocybe cf. subviscida]|uniref:Uncharacterized protein n=1 Tax=Psilocybe cf. subviscida TaxID=2480587 RepID=A0A8H5AU63_9AGAR|nr:hypothetical protein D9619_007944 [Psilocybe cf. subviscida]
MAPSIWTAEERELLAEYLEPYKARDEDQRILLLENKVIPKFLALFPPPRPADTGGAKNGDREMYERQRLVRQRIRTWFVKKVPTNVSHTPRRNPRARGDPDEREILKHHIENYRIAGDKLRKILVATQVLPDYVRHFAPVTEVYKLSQEQRKRYRKHVSDWLTIEAYYREQAWIYVSSLTQQGEQDPEEGLRLNTDPTTNDGASSLPTIYIGRRRRLSLSEDQLPVTKKQRGSPSGTFNTPTTRRRSPTPTPSLPELLKQLEGEYEDEDHDEEASEDGESEERQDEEDQEEEELQEHKREYALHPRPVVASTPSSELSELSGSEEADIPPGVVGALTLGEPLTIEARDHSPRIVGSPERRVQSPHVSTPVVAGQDNTPPTALGPLYARLKNILEPSLYRETLQEMMQALTEAASQRTAQEQLNAVKDELVQARQEIQELQQQKETLTSQLAHMQDNTHDTAHNNREEILHRLLASMKELQTQSDLTISLVKRLLKQFKDIYNAPVVDNVDWANSSIAERACSRGHISVRPKLKSKGGPTAVTASARTVAVSAITQRSQLVAVEALVGRFRKSIGTQVTVTYYLIKLPDRPLDEAVWRPLEDFAHLPNSAIILEVFHAQAEAEGLNLSKSKDDYVYLRDAILAGWDSNGTVHRRSQAP